MIYIENAFVCMMAPLIVAFFCVPPKGRRVIIFALCGGTACLLSAYMNTFFAYLYSTDGITATTEIAPVIEEVMKFLPILFYMVIFEPEEELVHTSILTVALSFATFENICYLLECGTENLQYLLMRGFGTGAMHLVCGAMVSYASLFVWENPWYRRLSILGALCIAIVFHGQYNLLMSGGTTLQYIGCVLPILAIVGGYHLNLWLKIK